MQSTQEMSPYVKELISAAMKISMAKKSIRAPSYVKSLETALELVSNTVDRIVARPDGATLTEMDSVVTPVPIEDMLVDELPAKACGCDSDSALSHDNDPTPDELDEARSVANAI